MSEIRLQRRPDPARLRYLAAKLREGGQNRAAVMLALEVMADEIELGRIATEVVADRSGVLIAYEIPDEEEQ